MGSSKTVAELLGDIGIHQEEKDSLKADLFGYLDEATGSEEQTCQLPSAQIRAHCQEFVDTDRGIEWFPRGNTLTTWRHTSSRQDVFAALNELAIRWLKHRRVSFKKHAAFDQSRKTNTSQEATAAEPDHTPVPVRTSSAIANKEMPDRPDEYQDEADDDSDGRTDPFSDTGRPAGNPSYTESLPDLEDVIFVKYVKTPGQASPPALTRKVEARESPNTTQGRNFQVPQQFTSVSAEVSTPARTAQCAPPSPSTKKLKRKAYQAPDFEDQQEDESTARKIVRLSIKRPADQSVVPAPREVVPDTDTVPALNEPLPLMSANKDPPQPPCTQPATAPPYATLLKADMSASRSFPYQATFSPEALASIPATILDHVWHCQQKCLKKGRTKGIATADRQKYRDRARMLHELHGDLESRILSLAHEIPKAEGDVDAFDSDEDSGPDEEGVQVSSYCLWN